MPSLRKPHKLLWKIIFYITNNTTTKNANITLTTTSNILTELTRKIFLHQFDADVEEGGLDPAGVGAVRVQPGHELAHEGGEATGLDRLADLNKASKETA